MPELGMMLATDLVALDHFEGSALLIANAILPAAAADRGGRARRVPPGDRPARRDDHGAVPPDPADGVHCGAVRGYGDVISRTPEGEYPKAVEVGQGGDPGRRVLPDRGRPALRAADRRRPAGHLPGAADHQPEPVHVPAALRRLRRRRLLARGARQGQRAAGAAAPDRRHALAGRDPGRGRRARRRAAGRPQGAGRARHARRSCPQRPRPGLPAGHRRGAGVHDRRALQPRHAHRVHCGR